MPKRVIDFDALWGSDKIAACAEWAQAEYAWLYGLADPSGCFELTNMRVIWGRVAAIRRNLTIERLEQVFTEFQDKGLLFVWEQAGKRYGHWTGSDVPGRLPPPSWRMRLERLAPAVPKQMLAEYVSRFARGRAASPKGFADGGVREEGQGKSEGLDSTVRGKAMAASAASEYLGGCGIANARGTGQVDLRFEISDLKCPLPGESAADAGLREGEDASRLLCGGGEGSSGALSEFKDGVEEAHAQDLGLGLDLKWKRNGKWSGVGQWAPAGRAADAGNELGNHPVDLGLKANSNSETKTLLYSSSNPGAVVDGREREEALAFRTAKASACASTERNENSTTRVETDRCGRDDVDRNPRTGDEFDRVGLKVDSRAWPNAARRTTAYVPYRNAAQYKAELLERELRVGEGPSSRGPVKVKPEALERIRLRNARGNGSHSP